MAKTCKSLLSSVMEHNMTSFEFSSCHTEERNELGASEQFENEMLSYHALQLSNARLPMF